MSDNNEDDVLLECKLHSDDEARLYLHNFTLLRSNARHTGVENSNRRHMVLWIIIVYCSRVAIDVTRTISTAEETQLCEFHAEGLADEVIIVENLRHITNIMLRLSDSLPSTVFFKDISTNLLQQVSHPPCYGRCRLAPCHPPNQTKSM